MTELEKLEDGLYADFGLTVDYNRVADQNGIIIIEEGQTPYIAVDRRLDRRRRTAVAYHEAGHLYRGITRWTRRDERRAEKWAIKQLITLNALIEGIKKHPRSLYELADNMRVDEGLLKSYLMYKARTRLYEKHGDYLITYCPIIVYSWRTGQMWPEE